MRIVLIDTCAEIGSIALADGGHVVRSAEIPARSASAVLLSSIQSLLESVGWSTRDVEGIGVVSGPGSFTGVRVGLACAKGLCEALAIPLVAISRLRVLAYAGGLQSGLAALSAGRGQAYVLDFTNGSEQLMSTENIVSAGGTTRILVAEEKLLHELGEDRAQLQTIDARSALPLVLECFRNGGDDLETVDANYVRGERQIYGVSRQAKGR